MKTGTILLLLAALAFVALAADVSGKWKAEYTSPDGQSRTSLFTFKVDGEKLTGTVGGARGEAAIQDGKISGDDISFAVVRNFGGEDVKLQYKGKVSGNEMKLSVSFGERSFEMTAKRESQ